MKEFNDQKKFYFSCFIFYLTWCRYVDSASFILSRSIRSKGATQALETRLEYCYLAFQRICSTYTKIKHETPGYSGWDVIMEGNTTYRFPVGSFRREITSRLKMAGSEGSFNCNTIFPYGISQSKFPERFC